MANLCAATPTLTVRDNRGLDVRTLRYNRNAAGTIAAQYVDAQTHNVLGQPAASQDPRFFGGATLNFQYTAALSGQVLKTVSVDAGTSKACADIAGQPIWQYSEGRDANLQSDKQITVLLSYDALGRPVQRACYTADVSDGGSAGSPTDIWSYGDYSGPAGATYAATDATDSRNANQRGKALQHFDTAGLIDMSAQGYAVQGIALRQDRRFLSVPCDSIPRWKSGTLKALYGLNKQWLESDTDPTNLYAIRWTYNALAQVLTQVDAKGHQQQTAYDGAGRKYSSAFTPNGGTLTSVCAGITYNAPGAIDIRSDANNIQVAFAYEPQTTQRLISMIASRSAAAGASTTPLQALTYAYDGVGNVISLSDNSAGAQVTFFRNRAVTPDRVYTYDALYQLASASGRENYVNNTPKGTDWPGAQFNPATTSDYQAYTRAYTYDTGGNLTAIRSSNWSGATPPTRQLVVGSASNRAVCTANNPGATQANIDTYFDLAGQSIYLDANRNQPMYWTALHQLYCVVTTYRPPTPSAATGDWSNSDREQYAYDGSGQRVRKYASSMASNQANGNWNILDTRYLPGLELRGNTASGENLEVIVLDDGARVLNWAGGAGKPSDIPNLQLRYQYSDRQNSCQIETDKDGNVITQEEYYPYGGTAVLASRSNSEVKYKYIRYSGKERDATGLYYYGLRYYQPWIGRWINPDPAGTVDGQNLYCMVRNNPVTLQDRNGLMSGCADPTQGQASVNQPTQPRIPRTAVKKKGRSLEFGLMFEKNGVLKKTNWDGFEGVTLDIGHPGSEPPLWHPWDPQFEKGESVYKVGRSLHPTLTTRKNVLGLTETRVSGYESGGDYAFSSAAVSFSLPTVIAAGKERRVSYEMYKYVVLPLVDRSTDKTENTFENIAAYGFENFDDAARLAREATVDLVAIRGVDLMRLERGHSSNNPTRRLWESTKDKVKAELESVLEGKDHFSGQDVLYELLLDPEKLAKVTADLPGPSASANAAQESLNKRARPRKRNADPAGNNPPSKISRSNIMPQQAFTERFSAPPTPMLPQGPLMQPPSAFPMPRHALSEEFSAPPTPQLPQGPLMRPPMAFPMPQQALSEEFSAPLTPMLPPGPLMWPVSAFPTAAQQGFTERFSPPSTPQGGNMAAPLPLAPWASPHIRSEQVQPSNLQISHSPAPLPISGIEPTIFAGDAATAELLSMEHWYRQQTYQNGNSRDYWGM
ncbi:RHS repeat domain-containing protein [Bordetella sp. LUAb4]|uniref:RHS repeat domain-containing protein n=1 Tax=Bordetella sp. LUAb4 TaxID=2843195 RepID=UPI001E3B80C6|nr:RHS repeat-associated core domain-containing protein [Bordetella sp. LUAb4]